MKVIDVPERKRYEGWTDDEGRVGFNNYRLEGDRLILTHAEIAPRYRGRGNGGRLVQGTLEDARARGLTVVPVCPFVRTWIQQNPEYADLVDQKSREELAD